MGHNCLCWKHREMNFSIIGGWGSTRNDSDDEFLTSLV
jgi:hypothetical protein